MKIHKKVLLQLYKVSMFSVLLQWAPSNIEYNINLNLKHDNA